MRCSTPINGHNHAKRKQAPIRIVDIDENSLDRLGQWPWPRTQIATLVDKVGQAGAAAIGFDIVFAEPDRTSPQRIARILASNPSATQSFDDLKSLRDHDEILADAFRRTKIVGGTILTHTPDTTRPKVRTGFRLFGHTAIRTPSTVSRVCK